MFSFCAVFCSVSQRRLLLAWVNAGTCHWLIRRAEIFLRDQFSFSFLNVIWKYQEHRTLINDSIYIPLFIPGIYIPILNFLRIVPFRKIVASNAGVWAQRARIPLTPSRMKGYKGCVIGNSLPVLIYIIRYAAGASGWKESCTRSAESEWTNGPWQSRVLHNGGERMHPAVECTRRVLRQTKTLGSAFIHRRGRLTILRL